MKEYFYNVHVDLVVPVRVVAESEVEACVLAEQCVEGYDMASAAQYCDCVGMDACLTDCKETEETAEYSCVLI
jgi:hypothetical protein